MTGLRVHGSDLSGPKVHRSGCDPATLHRVKRDTFELDLDWGRPTDGTAAGCESCSGPFRLACPGRTYVEAGVSFRRIVPTDNSVFEIGKGHAILRSHKTMKGLDLKVVTVWLSLRCLDK